MAATARLFSPGSRSHASRRRPVWPTLRSVKLERETETAAPRSLCGASIDPRERAWRSILRKEVIQPQVPLRLPCYDFTPVADPTVVACPLAVSAAPSGRTNSHGVTGGVYKARERIHRGMLIRDY
jgi:hypothetical protein